MISFINKISSMETGKKKIMIVDDDKVLLEELEEALASNGYDIVAINDSTAVLNTAHRVKPNLILLDLKMPRINGHQVAIKLKNSPQTANIPIIAMTGYFTREEHIELLTVCGMETCLKKPFNLPDVVACIEKVLNKSKQAQ